jgi:hypothetical protein
MDKVIALTFLAFALCIAMSVMGGIISAIIWGASPSYPYGGSLLIGIGKTMFTGNVPTVVREILARIPVNMIDRIVTAFVGFGVAVALQRARGRVDRSHSERSVQSAYCARHNS